MPAPRKATLSAIDHSMKGRLHLQTPKSHGGVRKKLISKEPLSSTTKQPKKSLRLLQKFSIDSNLPDLRELVSSATSRSELSTKQLQTLNKGRGFFKLPSELRNMVYKEALMSTPRIKTEWMDIPAVLHFSGTSEEDLIASDGIPTWLLTCRKIFYEGRAVLRGIFDHEIGPYFSAERFGAKDPSLQVAAPSMKQSLTVSTHNLVASIGPTEVQYHPGILGHPTIKHLATKLRLEGVSISQMLRHLRLQVDFVNVCPTCQSQAQSMHLNAHQHISWSMDLSFLEMYGLNLDSFELQVRNVDTYVAQDGYIHHENHWTQVKSCFREEVKRVGGVLTRKCSGDVSEKEKRDKHRGTVLFRYGSQVSRHTTA